MKRLRAAENRRECLNRCADDVHVGLLSGQRRACGLRVKAKHQGFRIFRAESFAHNLRPKPSRGAKFGDFFEKIVVSVEKERQSRRKIVNF